MIFDRLLGWVKPRIVTGPAIYYAVVTIVSSLIIFFGYWSFGAGLEAFVIPVLPLLAIAYRSIMLGMINLGWILFLSYFYDFGWAYDVTDGTALIGAWIALPVIVYVISLFRCDTLRSTEEFETRGKSNNIACRHDIAVTQHELPQLFFLSFFVFVATGILLGSLEFTSGIALRVFHLKPFGLRLAQLAGTLFVAFLVVEIIYRSTYLRRSTRFDARLILQQELWSVFGREQELFGVQRQLQRKRKRAKEKRKKNDK